MNAKRLFILIAVLLAGCAAFFHVALSNPVRQCTPAPAGLVAWWPFDGNASDILSDNTATLSGAPSFGAGMVAEALEFDGVDDHAVVKAAASLNVGTGEGLTIDLWINPAEVSTQRPLVEWNNGSGFIGAHLWISVVGPVAGPRNLYANLADTVGRFHVIESASDVIAAGTYQHVAITYDKVTGLATLYVNGAVVAQQNMGAFTPQTSYDLYFGLRPSGAAGGTRYVGGMDELEIVNRALSSEEIAAIYNAGSAGKCKPPCVAPPPGLVGWWPGDGNGQDIGGGNDGTLTGDISFGKGLVGQTFTFDGIRDAVVVGNPAGLQLQDLTIGAWVKRADLSQATRDTGNPLYPDGEIFCYGSYGYGFGLRQTGSACRPFFTKVDVSDVFADGLEIKDLDWHYVAVTKSGSTVIFYLDGVAYPAAAYNPVFTFSSPAAIGARGDNLRNSILGSIDELEIYNRALFADEIAAIFAAGSAGKCKPACVPPPAGMAGWWPGDGNGREVINGNNGVLVGGASFGAGMMGQAFEFDGVDGFVNAGNPTDLRVAGSDFTVDAWVYFNSLVAPANATASMCYGPSCDMSIVSKMVSTDVAGGKNRDGWRLLKQSDDHLWFCLGAIWNGCQADAPTTVRSATVVEAGQWYHVAAVKNSDGISIYVNGALEDWQPPAPHVDTDAADLLLGYYARESFMDGRIDEVEVFHRALSAEEIQAIFAAGGAGKCKPMPPEAPSDLTATVKCGTQVRLRWTDTTSDESGYRIQRSTTATGPWTTIATLPVDTTVYVDTDDLTPLATYYYRVRAYNAAGNSPFSNVASVTTTDLSTPSNLVAIVKSATRIKLTWTDTTTSEGAFRVQRAPSPAGPWAVIANTAANVTVYNDTTVDAGMTYYYRVRATNATGKSCFSNVAVATVPSGP